MIRDLWMLFFVCMLPSLLGLVICLHKALKTEVTTKRTLLVLFGLNLLLFLNSFAINGIFHVITYVVFCPLSIAFALTRPARTELP